MNKSLLPMETTPMLKPSPYLLEVPGLLTAHNTQVFKQELEELLEKPLSPQKIILDFAKTSHIDSSGLVGLRQIVELVKQVNIDLVCWSIRPQIEQIIIQAGLGEILNHNRRSRGIYYVREDFHCHPSVTSKIKRLIDILGALVGLMVTALLFIPIAIAIQIDNPGPILFSQERMGFLNKPFRIWKFRSMVVNAEQIKNQVENQANGPIFKNQHDPRITRVGRFLRKTSLDEFPQFWNVLKGDMSLVGTRPPTVEELKTYEIAYGQRLNVKPGLTGEWQVNGRSKITNFDDILKLDLNYQHKWSIVYDIQLVFKTFKVLFVPQNGAC